jgi:polyisoprenoid-binding protein YceI
MKNSSAFLKIGCVAAILSAAAIATVARAEDMVRYLAYPVGDSVRIEGEASIHHWDMEASIISGFIEIPAQIKLDSTLADVAGIPADGKIPIHAETHMPVTDFKNTHFDGMTEVMQDAMGAKDFPEIEYHLTEITLKQPHAANTPFQFNATGNLSLHGVTNKISMPVTIESLDKMKLKIVGKDIPISMVDYGIKPPVKAAIFTTKPDVKISFEWIVRPPKNAAAK